MFFFNDTATTEIYTYVHTLSLHDALPIYRIARKQVADHRDDDHPERGADQPMDETQREQHLETRRQPAADRQRQIGEERRDEHALAPEAVRQRTVKQRPEPDAKTQNRNNMPASIDHGDATRFTNSRPR